MLDVELSTSYRLPCIYALIKGLLIPFFVKIHSSFLNTTVQPLSVKCRTYSKLDVASGTCSTSAMLKGLLPVLMCTVPSQGHTSYIHIHTSGFHFQNVHFGEISVYSQNRSLFALIWVLAPESINHSSFSSNPTGLLERR